MFQAYYVNMNACIQLLQESWVHKMIERKRNLEKNMKKRSPSEPRNLPLKKSKVTSLQQRYPVTLQVPTEDDSESVQRHIKALEDEMAKEKPRDHLLLPLMKSTYCTRRMEIESDELPVADLLKKFGASKRISVVRIDVHFARSKFYMVGI